VFTANREGEYKFCFNNGMSTFAEKFVDFEISVGLPTPLKAVFGGLDVDSWVWFVG